MEFRLIISENTKTFTGYAFRDKTNSSDTSISFLRSKMSSLPNVSSIVTGWWTENGTSTGAFVPWPNTLFLLANEKQ